VRSGTPGIAVPWPDRPAGGRTGPLQRSWVWPRRCPGREFCSAEAFARWITVSGTGVLPMPRGPAVPISNLDGEAVATQFGLLTFHPGCGGRVSEESSFFWVAFFSMTGSAEQCDNHVGGDRRGDHRLRGVFVAFGGIWTTPIVLDLPPHRGLADEMRPITGANWGADLPGPGSLGRRASRDVCSGSRRVHRQIGGGVC